VEPVVKRRLDQAVVFVLGLLQFTSFTATLQALVVRHQVQRINMERVAEVPV
jgi:hypothetical protein